MDIVKLKKGIELIAKLDDTNNKIKRVSILCNSPFITLNTVGQEGYMNGLVINSSVFEKYLKDNVLYKLYDEKEAIETQIKNL